MSSMLSADQLMSALTGDPEALDVHLSIVERDLSIKDSAVSIHCHCLTLDGNGKVQPRRLAEFMRSSMADYAIPKARLKEAKARDIKYNSTDAVAALLEEARNSFTDLAKSGEGGELLLYMLAERFLKLPQILCKMHLKTDSKMHYHGADGVYAGVQDDGVLKLYWGESKIYKDAGAAIKDCISSLKDFLIEEEHESSKRERDLVLLSDKADLNDKDLNNALRRYFDKSSPLSNRVKYCAIALVGFDSKIYPKKGASGLAEEIVKCAKAELGAWQGQVGKRIAENGLGEFEIQVLCLPLPSADDFRSAFSKALGVGK